LFDIFGINDPNDLTTEQKKIIETLNRKPEMVVHVKNLLGIND
jgi:hypothetical protein